MPNAIAAAVTPAKITNDSNRYDCSRMDTQNDMQFSLITSPTLSWLKAVR